MLARLLLPHESAAVYVMPIMALAAGSSDELGAPLQRCGASFDTRSQLIVQPLPLRELPLSLMGTPTSSRDKYRVISSLSVKGTRTPKECGLDEWCQGQPLRQPHVLQRQLRRHVEETGELRQSRGPAAVSLGRQEGLDLQHCLLAVQLLVHFENVGVVVHDSLHGAVRGHQNTLSPERSHVLIEVENAARGVRLLASGLDKGQVRRQQMINIDHLQKHSVHGETSRCPPPHRHRDTDICASNRRGLHSRLSTPLHVP